MLGFNVSAHRVARKFGHRDVLELLLDRSSADLRLIDACWMSDALTAQAILAKYPGLPRDLTDIDRREVAHAARDNETSVVRLMLECGWPVDATGQHRATPLHWAAFNGNAEMSDAILRFGPPLEQQDADYGGTPLGWAIYGSQNGWHCRTGDYAATVEALLRAGAKPPGAIEGSSAVRDVLRGQAAGD